MADKYKSLREMDDKEVLWRVKGDYAYFKSMKAEDNERNRRYEKIYQALDNPDDNVDETTGNVEYDSSRYSNSYMPIGAAIADALSAKLYNAFFSTPEYFEIAADNWEDEIAAHKCTAHLKKRHREMKFRNKVGSALLQAACHDYCITGTRWLMKPGYRNVREKKVTYRNYGGIKLPYQDVRMVQKWFPNVIDRSDMFVLNYFNCYHDPTCENSAEPFMDSKAFIDEREEMVETLIGASQTRDNPHGTYKNIDKVISSCMQDWEKQSFDDPSLFDDKDFMANWLGSRRVKIIRYWTGDHIVECAQDEVIRRVNVCGWPLQKWGIYEMPGSFKSMGVLQRIERNQYDINDTINTRNDFRNLITDPITVIDQELVVEEEGAPNITSGKVFVSTSGSARDKIDIHNPGIDISQNAMQDVAVQSDMIEKVTVSENDMGSYKGGRRSATETVKVGQGADNKTFLISQRIEEGCLIEIYRNQFILEQSYLTVEERFKYYGKYGNESMVITPADYAWRSQPVFYAKGTSDMMNEPIKMQQFFVAMDRAMAMPQLHNWEKIMAHMWSKLAPEIYTEFIKDPRAIEHNVPPEIENLMIAHGRKPQRSPQNDDRKHLASHNGIKHLTDYMVWPERFKRVLDEHIAEHEQGANQMLSMMTQGQPMGMQGSADPMRGTRQTSMIGGTA